MRVFGYFRFVLKASLLSLWDEEHQYKRCSFALYGFFTLYALDGWPISFVFLLYNLQNKYKVMSSLGLLHYYSMLLKSCNGRPQTQPPTRCCMCISCHLLMCIIFVFRLLFWCIHVYRPSVLWFEIFYSCHVDAFKAC